MEQKRKKWSRAVSASFLIVGLMILFVVLFVGELRLKSRNESIRQLTESIDGVGRSARLYLDDACNTTRDWAKLIRRRLRTQDDILSELCDLNSNPLVTVQLIDTDTLKGVATSEGGGSVVMEVSYEKYYDLADDLHAIMTRQSQSVYVTSFFLNPATRRQSVAFACPVPVTQEDGRVKTMLLLRVEPLSLVQEHWDISDSTGLQLSLVNVSGAYMLRAPMLKNSNFFEFLRSYNDLTYPELDALQQEIIHDADSGYFIFKNSLGHDTLFIYSSKVRGKWFFVGAIEMADLPKADVQWSLLLVMTAGFVLLILINVRYYSKVNRSLRESLIQADAANVAKTNFLSSMSHDIRTPMNAILGMTEVASCSLDNTALVRDCLARISSSGQLLLTLINDILDISKIESGKFVLTPQPLSLKAELDALMNISRPQAETKHLELHLETRDILHDSVMADKLRLDQIFINILSNAIKYTPEGGRVEVLLRQEALGDEQVKLVYQVRDNGIGMSEAFQKTLFEPFTREQTARVGAIQGSGLGMAITKQMTDLMHGTIQVQSQQGKGSTFTVSLPLTVAAPIEAPQTDAPHPALRPDLEGLHLLVAEDNDLNWEVLSEMLSMGHVTADRAADGRQCLQMLQSAPAGTYALIFMDIQMPVMNGYEAAAAIRSLPDPEKAGIPIVAMTADAFAEDVASSQRAGMNGHVSKPISIKMVMNAIQTYARK